jgi:hypothetical protein
MRVPDETAHAAMSGKLSRKPIHESSHPHGIDRFCPVAVRRSWSAIGKAGLLASGSIYFPRLPVSAFNETVAAADFVPDHSGGTTPDFHGIPSYAPWAPCFTIFWSNQRKLSRSISGIARGIAFGTEYGKPLSQAWPALTAKAAQSEWYEIL